MVRLNDVLNVWNFNKGTKVTEYEFFIPGPPRPKLRPIAGSIWKGRGRQVATLRDPEENKLASQAIRDAWIEQTLCSPLDERITLPWGCNKDEFCKVRCYGLFERPKSVPDNWQMTSKPDVDNFAKLALDALNGLVYTDDAKTNGLLDEKGYWPTPGLILVIEFWKQPEKEAKRGKRDCGEDPSDSSVLDGTG